MLPLLFQIKKLLLNFILWEDAGSNSGPDSKGWILPGKRYLIQQPANSQIQDSVCEIIGGFADVITVTTLTVYFTLLMKIP